MSPYETEHPPWAPADPGRADDAHAATIAPQLTSQAAPYEIVLVEPDGRRVWRAANGAGVYLAGALRDELARRG